MYVYFQMKFLKKFKFIWAKYKQYKSINCPILAVVSCSQMLCFRTIVKPFYALILTTDCYNLPDLDYLLTVGLMGQQDILTPPTLLFPLLVRICHAHIFVLLLYFFGFFLDYEIYDGSLSLPVHPFQLSLLFSFKIIFLDVLRVENP